ncbi:MAG: hypothetical protein PHW04_16450 [Candidatus Wallbacteria bacterium]|nr:hypothetical protein [Candidatus Wallbacteria bacterium]
MDCSDKHRKLKCLFRIILRIARSFYEPLDNLLFLKDTFTQHKKYYGAPRDYKSLRNSVLILIGCGLIGILWCFFTSSEPSEEMAVDFFISSLGLGIPAIIIYFVAANLADRKKKKNAPVIEDQKLVHPFSTSLSLKRIAKLLLLFIALPAAGGLAWHLLTGGAPEDALIPSLVAVFLIGVPLLVVYTFYDFAVRTRKRIREAGFIQALKDLLPDYAEDIDILIE